MLHVISNGCKCKKNVKCELVMTLIDTTIWLSVRLIQNERILLLGANKNKIMIITTPLVEQ